MNVWGQNKFLRQLPWRLIFFEKDFPEVYQKEILQMNVFLDLHVLLAQVWFEQAITLHMFSPNDLLVIPQKVSSVFEFKLLFCQYFVLFAPLFFFSGGNSESTAIWTTVPVLERSSFFPEIIMGNKILFPRMISVCILRQTEQKQ